MLKYNTYTARLESFSRPQRSKVSPKSKAEYRWPHPATFNTNPESLAHAGFYYNPSSKNADAVTCFMCEKELTHWVPKDDPAVIHAEKCPKCPWAILTCISDTHKNGSFRFSVARLPTSPQMEAARLETFGRLEKRWWPHDGKNKGPSSEAMARAGFIYRPAIPGDDTCICIYCEVELNGWNPKDDPMEEHRSRQAKKGPCPFFTESTKSASTVKRATSKSKAPPPVAPETPQASSSDAEYEPPTTKSSPRSSTRAPSNKPSNSTSKSKGSSSKTSKKPGKGRTIDEEVVAEYQVVLDEDEPPKPRPKPRRASTRSRSASGSRSRASSSTQNTTTDDTDLATSSTRPSTVERSSRSASGSKDPEVSEDPSPPIPKPKRAKPKPAAKRKTKRSALQRSNASSSRVTDMDEEAGDGNEPHPKPILPEPIEYYRGRSVKGKTVEVATESKPHPEPKSFRSPADEELARDEEALEEQARALMLADPTLTFSSTPIDISEVRSGSQPRVEKLESAQVTHIPSPLPPTTLKGKGKSKVIPREDTMVIEKAVPALKPPTPPPSVPSALNGTTPSVEPPPLLLIDNAITLSEEERAMSVEQWIRHEMDRQFELLKTDGRRKIDAFKERAAEIARHIESL